MVSDGIGYTCTLGRTVLDRFAEQSACRRLSWQISFPEACLQLNCHAAYHGALCVSVSSGDEVRMAAKETHLHCSSASSCIITPFGRWQHTEHRAPYEASTIRCSIISTSSSDRAQTLPCAYNHLVTHERCWSIGHDLRFVPLTSQPLRWTE